MSLLAFVQLFNQHVNFQREKERLVSNGRGTNGQANVFNQCKNEISLTLEEVFLRTEDASLLRGDASTRKTEVCSHLWNITLLLRNTNSSNSAYEFVGYRVTLRPSSRYRAEAPSGLYFYLRYLKWMLRLYFILTLGSVCIQTTWPKYFFVFLFCRSASQPHGQCWCNCLHFADKGKSGPPFLVFTLSLSIPPKGFWVVLWPWLWPENTQSYNLTHTLAPLECFGLKMLF